MDDYLDFFEIMRLVCCLIVALNVMEFQGDVAYKVLPIKKVCIYCHDLFPTIEFAFHY